MEKILTGQYYKVLPFLFQVYSFNKNVTKAQMKELGNLSARMEKAASLQDGNGMVNLQTRVNEIAKKLDLELYSSSEEQYHAPDDLWSELGSRPFEYKSKSKFANDIRINRKYVDWLLKNDGIINQFNSMASIAIRMISTIGKLTSLIKVASMLEYKSRFYYLFSILAQIYKNRAIAFLHGKLDDFAEYKHIYAKLLPYWDNIHGNWSLQHFQLFMEEGKIIGRQSKYFLGKGQWDPMHRYADQLNMARKAFRELNTLQLYAAS